jgi:CDP-diacylglycerol--glycerol-3-phosphate 3-phosphatidyltransferase
MMPSPALKKLGRDVTRPFGKALASIGVTANAVTIIGLLFAAACGFFLARGQGIAAFLFLVASSMCDMLDGAVARAGGVAGTPMGAALDSTADRYGEALILAGVLIRDHNQDHSHGEWFLWLVVLTLTASFLTSYVRARAEGLGLQCDVGLFERPERLGLLALLCLFGPRFAPYILGLLALGAHVTVLQRLLLVRRSTRGQGGDQS